MEVKWDEIVPIITSEDRTKVRKMFARFTPIAHKSTFSKIKIDYRGKEYVVAYTKEEADRLGIEYKYYKDLIRKTNTFPMYVLFDDDLVGICFYIYIIGKWKAVVTALGFRMIHYDSKFDMDHPGKLKKVIPPCYFDVNNQPFNLSLTGAESSKTKKQLIAMLLAYGCSTKQIAAYFTQDERLTKLATIKTICNNKEVRQMANKFVKDVLAERGITPDKVLDYYEEAIEMAKKSKNAKAFIEICRDFAKWTGFDDKETQTQQNMIEATNYHEDMAKLTKSQETIKLTQQKEIANES